MFVRPPVHWSTLPGQCTSPFSVVTVTDERVLTSLKEFLCGTGIGDGGKDQKQHGSYARLELVGGWRVENHGLLLSYFAERERAMTLWGQEQVGFPKFKAKVPCPVRPSGFDNST